MDTEHPCIFWQEKAWTGSLLEKRWAQTASGNGVTAGEFKYFSILIHNT